LASVLRWLIRLMRTVRRIARGVITSTIRMRALRTGITVLAGLWAGSLLAPDRGTAGVADFMAVDSMVAASTDAPDTADMGIEADMAIAADTAVGRMDMQAGVTSADMQVAVSTAAL
jgi:hypothetical protein